MISVRLSRVLGEKRINQAELARRTGIRPATINEIYHELRDSVNLEHLDRICTALQCDLSEILEHRLDPPERLKEKLLEDAELRAEKAKKKQKKE